MRSSVAYAAELSQEGITNALYAPLAARLLEENHDLLLDHFDGLYVALSERVEHGRDITEEEERFIREQLEEKR